MIAKTPAPICDACGTAIDVAQGIISFVPLRGGLTLTVATDKGSASKDLTQQVDLCDETCLAEYVKQLRTTIKVPAPTKPTTETPAPTEEK
jgi:hypothetical protein